MAKKYEYHKRNNYPGERADEMKRVADAKAEATENADDRVAYTKAEERDRADGRVAYANSIADDRYDAKVSADNKRYNDQANRNRAGNGASWILALCLVVIAVFAVGWLWQPWNQSATTIPNTQANVAPAMSVSLTQAPTYETAKQTVDVKWNINGNRATITNTAIHYGPVSMSNPAVSSYPSVTVYQCASVACNIPGSFSAQMNFEKPGIYYYRVSAVMEGKQYWSKEVTMNIISNVQTPQKFWLIANTYGFSESNHEINTLSVKIGQPVELTLFVIDSGAIKTDLEFRGCGENSGIVKASDRGEVLYFTPLEDCTISSYMVGGTLALSTVTVKVV